MAAGASPVELPACAEGENESIAIKPTKERPRTIVTPWLDVKLGSQEAKPDWAEQVAQNPFHYTLDSIIDTRVSLVNSFAPGVVLGLSDDSDGNANR